MLPETAPDGHLLHTETLARHAEGKHLYVVIVVVPEPRVRPLPCSSTRCRACVVVAHDRQLHDSGEVISEQERWRSPVVLEEQQPARQGFIPLLGRLDGSQVDRSFG